MLQQMQIICLSKNDIHFIDLKDVNIEYDHFLIKGIHTKKK